MKDLTKVGDLEVMIREIAKLPYPNDHTKFVESPAIHQLLLSDESIVFQCMHRNGEDCTYTAPTAKSVASHQRTHADRLIAKRAIAAQEAAEAELAERKTRASERAVKAAATRNLNRTNVAQPTDNVPATPADVTKAINRVAITANALDDAIEAHREATLHLITMVHNSPSCDPQIIAKAKAYDDFKTKLFNV